MQLPTIEALHAEGEAAGRSIRYNGPEWLAIERWAEARRWEIALTLTSPAQTPEQALHNRARYQALGDLLALRDKFGKLPTIDNEA